MTRRHYQFFALALLIGAPLLVSMLSNMLFGIGHLAPQGVAPPPVQSSEPVRAEPAPSPPPAPQNMQPVAPFSTGPTLDPTGTAVAGSDPMTAAPEIASAAPTLLLPGDEGSSGASSDLDEANP